MNENIKKAALSWAEPPSQTQEGVRLNTRQRFCFDTTKQAYKIASLKIAIIAEAHHGLGKDIGCMIDRHDKLLSAAFAAATFLVMHSNTLLW